MHTDYSGYYEHGEYKPDNTNTIIAHDHPFGSSRKVSLNTSRCLSDVLAPRFSTLTGQKFLNTTIYPCTDCAIYRLNIQLGAKMGIETFCYQKFVVLALTLVKMFDF